MTLNVFKFSPYIGQSHLNIYIEKTGGKPYLITSNLDLFYICLRLLKISSLAISKVKRKEKTEILFGNQILWRKFHLNDQVHLRTKNDWNQKHHILIYMYMYVS